MSTKRKVESGELCEEVHRLHQSVLYFQNAIRFLGTRENVLTFTSITEVRPSLRQFSRNSKKLNSSMCRSLVSNGMQIGQ